MSGCRQFVQRLRRARKFAALPAVFFASWVVADGGRLEPHVTAREFAPGELVRFEVVTDPAVTSLRGEFRKASLSFVRSAESSGTRTWIAWGVIPLDAEAGPSGYRVTAARTDAPAQSATGEIEILKKEFPEQRLTVESKFVNPPSSAQKRIESEKKRLDRIYAARTPLPPSTSPFVRPVPGEPTSQFGTHRFFNGEPRAPHPGLDLHADSGTPVVVAGPGRVVLAEDLYYSGGTVIVDHGGGLFTVYAHLSKITAKNGATVAGGDPVGRSGATGRVTGPHLHWGARVGEAIFDPRALLDPRLFGESAGAVPDSKHP